MFAITNKDFYKTDHRRQYPEGTDMVYSNFTPRSSKLANVIRGFYDDKIVWFGLQAFIIDFLVNEFNDTFFNVPKNAAVNRYRRRLDNSLGKGAVPLEHIEALHDLGYLPLKIKSLPEGARVNIKVPPMTIINTLPEFYWLVNDLETVMSSELWKPSTCATIAYEFRKIMTHYAELTGSPVEFVALQGHDFSFRGMSGRKDAAFSGMGHLLSFIGTDTIPAIDAAEDFYFANSDNEVIGVSVPATEHSVMCMGTQESEIDTFRRLITDLYPTGIVSIVSDTWDFWKVITQYSLELKDEIMARQPDALGLNKVVFRPDSGDPVKILTGYACGEFEEIDGKFYEIKHLPGHLTEMGRELSEAEVKGAVECLWDIFGGTETEQGFKVLDEHVGLIYGDSINLERANQIMARLMAKGFASCNVVLGIGSFTYQYNTRDSFGWAMKATAGSVNGELREIFKDPATDNGTKKSAKGLLRVEYEDGDYVLYDQQTPEQEAQGALEVVFEDGQLIKTQTFAEIRERLVA